MTDAPAVEKTPQEPVAADAPPAPAAPTVPKSATEAPVAEKPAEAVPATADQEVPQLGTNGTPSTQTDAAKPVTEANEAHGRSPKPPPPTLGEVEAPQVAGSKPTANGEVKDVETKDAAEETHRMEPDTGDKRKADDTTDVNGLKGSTNGAASEKVPEAAGRAGKKQKTNGASEPAPATTARKPKGGKKKKQLAPVGRTARKTRSQGPVEV